MRNLRDLLSSRKSTEETALSKPLDEKTIFFICKKILQEEYGSRGSENIEAVTYKEKKLSLRARNSLWRNEAALQKEHLKNRINTLLAQEAVEEIKIFY
ncbi:MAG: hypothetical protein A2808_03640 [Candidatus Moranbacteria bacterium RIFCSPHIGHO2_01_FULL_55_24]|nr:MAG: hypothetical protein A2808_03640 [Candidatus Moranbacteria bacterium RIFCSPHIGHO2_01_FULL_55_24]